MDIDSYFKSLSSECETLKNRVRMLIDDAHWPTDGEWKESVLRNMIKRSAPESVTVGRGFVVTENGCSKQIDILIYDNSFPVIYKDGDLVFIAPNACKAIIEVKSIINATILEAAANDMASNASLIRTGEPNINLFVGIFSYDIQPVDARPLAKIIRNASNNIAGGLINHASFGKSKFVKFWETNPTEVQNTVTYNSWHLYNLENMAQGYFIHNVLSYLCNHRLVRNENVWFPRNGKEAYLEESVALNPA